MKKKPTVEELERIRQELTEQLIQSERIRSLGTLSGGVAHHFNNLLSVILGYSSFVLNREKLSKEATDALQKITEAAQRGRRLTEELLAFAGSEVEEETLCRIHETLNSVLSLLSSQVPTSVRVETHLDAERDTVLGPRSVIHQVVFNLVTNAFDSMPAGGQLIVRTSNMEVDTDAGLQEYLRIEVTDSGGALPEAIRARPEEALAGSTPPTDRVGLKLSSIYGMVGRLDGTVLLSSDPGSLTRVEVLLPTATAEIAARREPRVRKRLAPSAIWVVDDDPTFREMCEVVLGEQGHTVMGIGGGKELQDLWGKAAKAPDLIIIDFSMPDFNGLELCQWLARQGARVPVVLVSGLSSNQPDIRKALEMKKTYFLQKPFGVRELADVVTVAMGETLIGE